MAGAGVAGVVLVGAGVAGVGSAGAGVAGVANVYDRQTRMCARSDGT